jgi:hypothetical protein
MGKHVNTRLQNWITYATVFLLVGMTGLIVVLGLIR